MGQFGQRNSGFFGSGANTGGTVTSVGLVMPTPASPAYTVSNSPITGSGDLIVTANGTASQYVRGDGSLATFPSLTGYVPYTGATTDVVLGNFSLSAKSIFITGTGGNGFEEYIAQSSTPSAPVSGFRFYANSTNALSWIGQNGFTRTFDGTSNTANRVYTLPNATTTMAGLSVGTSGTPQAFTGYNTWSALSVMTNNTLTENVLTLNSTRIETTAGSTDRMLRLVNSHTIQTGDASFVYPIDISNTVTLTSSANNSYIYNNTGTTTITGSNNTVGLMRFAPTITDNNSSGNNTTHTGIEMLYNITLGTGVSGITNIRGVRIGGNITGSGGGNKDIQSSQAYTYDRTFTAALRNVSNTIFNCIPTYNNGTDLTSTGYYYSATLGGTLIGAIQHRAFWNTNGDVYLCSSAGNVGIATAPSSTDKFQISGNISLVTAGNKIKIATGTNASIGTSAAMVAGTVTVNTTAVTANSRIQLTINTVGGTVGVLSAPTASIIAGTSFVINSSSNTDTSTVNWWIIN